ncbi:MAG: septation regulator SpoVG [Candidatus Carbobacillus sp.]|nr:septation regulator SpoVG [Candidatus Carbobacillus sp.]
MEITHVRLRPVQSEGRMRAIVSVTFDDEFVVHDIRVIDGNNGLFVAMPSKRTPDGEFRDIAHPISAQTREKLQKAILEVYAREHGGQSIHLLRSSEASEHDSPQLEEANVQD